MNKRAKQRKTKQESKNPLANTGHSGDGQVLVQQSALPFERNEQAIGGEKGGGSRGKSWKEDWPHRLESLCAVLLVLITGLYTHYAREQAKASNLASRAATGSLDTIKQQFQINQQAWITPTVSAATELKKGAPFMVKIHFANTGKTPASNVYVQAIAQKLRKDQAPSLTFPAPMTNGYFAGLVFPSQSYEFEIGTYGLTGPLNAADYDDLRLGDAYLATYIRLTFLDVFGIEHSATMCSWKAYSKGLFHSRACAEYNKVEK